MFDPNDTGAPGQEKAKPRTTRLLDKRVLRSLQSREGQQMAKAGASLDTPEAKALHRRLIGLYLNELDIQADNRAQMHLDEEFYDNIQYEEGEEERIRDLGMVPIVCNVIATTINWIIGTERRMRTDFKILPRRAEDGPAAQAKTEYLKFVSDANYLPFKRSAAFEEAVKSGIGFLEDGIQDGAGDPIMSDQVSWRNVLWDSNAKADQSNARYQFKSRHVDLDILEALFPRRRGQLRMAASNSEDAPGLDAFGDEPMDSVENETNFAGGAGTDVDADYSRPRVRVIEAWFTKPAKVQKLIKGEQPGGTFIGEIYDPMSRGHWNELASGQAIVADRTEMRVFVAIMTTTDLLHVQESPYRHNRFPLTPIWCYRRGATGQPYGVIRGLRTMQEDINRRLMKALAIISSNKTIMDEGAVPDLDEYAEEAARPDGIIVKSPGKHLEMGVDRDLSATHMQIMSAEIALVQSVSGVTDENLGRKTNASSGIAITARQDQGALATAAIFDNLRLSSMRQGEIQLSLIEQFVDEERQFRVVSARGKADFLTVNSTDAESGEVMFEDDITASKADFVISEQAWASSMRQAQVAELMQVITQLATAAPQVALAVLDLAVELMDIPSRDEFVKRIRGITGMPDPDATEPTPEEQAKAKAAQEAQDRAVRMEEATIAEKEASASQKGAAAAEAETRVRNAAQDEVLKRIEAQAQALMLAVQAISTPAAAPVADIALREAGYRTRPEEAEDEAILAQAEADEMEAAEAEAAAQMMPPQEEQAAPQPPIEQP